MEYPLLPELDPPDITLEEALHAARSLLRAPDQAGREHPPSPGAPSSSTGGLPARTGREAVLPPSGFRALSAREITLLESFGNSAADWGRIFVAGDFDPRAMRGNFFAGTCVLGTCSGRPPAEGDHPEHPAPGLPTGISHSTLVDAVTGREVTIHRCPLVSRFVIGDGSVLIGSTLTCSGHTSFGNGVAIPCGVETGGRDLLSFAWLPFALAERIASRREDHRLQEAYRAFVARYVESVTFTRGVVSAGACVTGSAITDAFIGCGAVLTGVSLVEKSTVLSSPEERTRIGSGTIVRDSVVQWGCTVDSGAQVESSVLMEHSSAERHGRVSGSIVGPNTTIGGGEVSASFMGPFVGFHHQSLLIAAFWPEGRGNIGYGANVGSNHTSRLPDQEIWPGEGVFFGLGCSIKFPANFRGSPYSLIATGVTTLPQKLEFPFSLITQPFYRLPGVPDGFNQILPAWTLSDNIYALRRNEEKYRARNRAKRSRFAFDIFTPRLTGLMLEAAGRLEGVREKKERYLPNDIPGLGKNYLLEADRLKAIATYRFFASWAASRSLRAEASRILSAAFPGPDGPDRPLPEPDGPGQVQNPDGQDKPFGAQPGPAGRVQGQPGKARPGAAFRGREELLRALQADEGLSEDFLRFRELEPRMTAGAGELREALGRYRGMLREIGRQTLETRKKDDERGTQVIDDYRVVHPSAAEDPFVLATFRQMEEEIRETERLLEFI